jgi:hypothetical protein
LFALGALAGALVCLVMLALSPAPQRPQPLSLARLIEAPVQTLAVAAGLAAPPKPWDNSPAKLGARIKTSGCRIDGPYPDAACSPGAIFASTSIEVICTPGYTQTVRNVSTKLKRQVYAQYGIAYPQPAGTFEADHLIPLELGGSNDIANLFPEAAAPAPGFKEKDLVENYLHAQVCDGLMPLPRAQEEIASDWLGVYRSLSASDLAQLRAAYSSWADKN